MLAGELAVHVFLPLLRVKILRVAESEEMIKLVNCKESFLELKQNINDLLGRCQSDRDLIHSM